MNPKVREILDLMETLGIVRITHERDARRIEDRDVEIWYSYSTRERKCEVIPHEDVKKEESE